MPSITQNQVDREDSAFIFLYVFSLVWFIFSRKKEKSQLQFSHKDFDAEWSQFLCIAWQDTLNGFPHLWVMVQVLHWEPHGNTPATSRNFPSTGGSKIWLLIKITGGALKKYSCLGPNYQKKLILVFLGNEAHSFVFLKSLQITLMCNLSW